MTVVRRVTKNPITVHSGDTLALADAAMRGGDFRRVPVVDAGRLVGILSEFDLEEYRERLSSVLVERAMTVRVVTVSSSATLEHAIDLLRRHNIGALPVVDHGRLVCIVTATDLGLTEPQPLPEWDPRRHRESPIQFSLFDPSLR
jgi:acetoin utilization protein AcuB